ncbi:hypothetical protein A0H81_12151 [Grifola frondosa]|uniref:AMP-dependent synthetase/ligase domain-containing protein n=1 Tax=Grifola frondosa TaxID=5627 RepID=A0A1C7LSZ0_GRIFR|nr:hypothetical protein A0H81_12151 [Grifola frondosa]
MKIFTGTPMTFTWSTLTYGDFLRHLNATTAYWAQDLRSHGLQRGNVVGIWLTGSVWMDLVHIYALSGAGFVPELFGLAFSAVIVHDLCQVSGAKALIYDPSFGSEVSQAQWDHPVLCLPGESFGTPDRINELSIVSDDDVAMIVHTSGTTSGRPKPIPQTHRWLKGLTRSSDSILQGSFPTGSDIYNNTGSFASIAAASCILVLTRSGSCLVQTSGREIGAEEFLAMVRDCGLNRLAQYAPWLSKLISVARQRPDVLEALRGLRQVAYTGASISTEDEKWAIEQGIPITQLYSTTECGTCMVADLASKEPYLRISRGLTCRMILAEADGRPDLSGATTPLRLYDFFVPADCDHCPHRSVRNRPDGHVTGDLFQEVKPGCYLFRGRNDDWIRTGGNPAFCDTKAIEDNVRKTCSDIVHNCVVVGHHKPFPVLLAEPTDASAGESELSLKNEIIRRTAPFNDQLLSHEKITTPSALLLVPCGTLPRTTEKGNIRRKATEEIFYFELAQIYASAS